VIEQYVPATAKVTTPVPKPPVELRVMVEPTVALRLVLETVNGSCVSSVVPTVNLKYSDGLVALA
jgi:hypothetical protein